MPKICWDSVNRFLTSDSTGLLVLGALGFVRGISYFPPLADPNRNPAHLLEYIFPPYIWGILWVLVGVGCVVAVFIRETQPLAVGCIVGMHFLWAVSFLGGGNRGWVTALSYFCVFALTLWAFGRGRRDPDAMAPPVIPEEPREGEGSE